MLIPPMKYKAGDQVVLVMPDQTVYSEYFGDEDPRILTFGIGPIDLRKNVNKDRVLTVRSWYCDIYGGKESYCYSLQDEEGNKVQFVWPWWMLSPLTRSPNWEV